MEINNGSISSTVGRAREWIGGMIQGAANALRSQSVQLEFSRDSSFVPNILNDGRRSAPDDRTHETVSPFFDQFKKTCLQAFAGRDNNRTSRFDETEVSEEVHWACSGEGKKRVTQMNSSAMKFNVSIESVDRFSESKTIKSETAKTDTLKQKSDSISYASLTNCLEPNQKQFSDAAKDLEVEENLKEQQTYSTREDIKNEGIISRLYSFFSKRMNKLEQRNKHRRSSRSCLKKIHLLRNSIRRSLARKSRRRPSCPSVKYNPEVSGKISLDMQHFKKSRQLRIILGSVECSAEPKERMFCKLSLTGNKSSQKHKTRLFRKSDEKVNVNETFYMDLKQSELDGYVLNIQLRTVKRLLQRPTTLATVRIALDKIDLMFDTSIRVPLRDPTTLDQDLAEDEVEIFTENKSIHAEVSALLQESNYLFTGAFKRHSLSM